MCLDVIKKSLQIECNALQALIDRIGPEAVQAVELILDCKGQVIVTGMGKAGLVGRKIAATMASTGTPAIFLHAAEAIHGDLGNVSREDVVLALSNSGESEEIVRLLPHLKRFGVKIISLTGRKQSTLGRYSDVVLDTTVPQEAEPLDIAPTASTTVQMAMGDALAAALVHKRGFTRDQYAVFHPGGALGKMLLCLVSDLMHKGEATPIVPETTTFNNAIVTMTSFRLGAIFVVGEDGALKGIVTDGDLRRIFQRTKDPWERPVAELMVAGPKTIAPQALATEAMRLMEEKAITILPVVDEQGKPVGAIHMHDLIKAGLA